MKLLKLTAKCGESSSQPTEAFRYFQKYHGNAKLRRKFEALYSLGFGQRQIVRSTSFRLDNIQTAFYNDLKLRFPSIVGLSVERGLWDSYGEVADYNRLYIRSTEDVMDSLEAYIKTDNKLNISEIILRVVGPPPPTGSMFNYWKLCRGF